MPLPNLQGTWMQGNFELIITGPTNDGEFKVKTVSAELMQYWQSGYGTVHESGKLTITFVKEDQNVQIQEMMVGGLVTADGKQIHFTNGVVWQRR
jgi:hypothetical protein